MRSGNADWECRLPSAVSIAECSADCRVQCRLPSAVSIAECSVDCRVHCRLPSAVPIAECSADCRVQCRLPSELAIAECVAVYIRQCNRHSTMQSTFDNAIDIRQSHSTIPHSQSTFDIRKFCNRQSPIGIESVRPLQLEAYIHEVVRRPGAGELERQLVVALPDFLDASVERLLHGARNEKGGVHDHPVADRFV
jgi:hypothetical protein